MVIKTNWLKFRNSRPGWTILVTLFALLFGLIAVVVAGVVGLPWLLGGGSSSPNMDVALEIIFPAVTLLLSVLFAGYFSKKGGDDLPAILGLKIPKRNVFWLVPLLLFVYIVVLVVSLSVLQMLSPELAEQKQDIATTVSTLGGWRLLVMVLSVGVLTPIAEETFFRGLLTSLYVKRLKFLTAIFFSSILFALAHGQVNIGIDTFFFGLILGFLGWKTESIYPAIGLHMLKNGLALSIILS